MSTDDLADVGPADKVVQPRLIRLQVIAYAIACGLCLGLFLFVVPKIEAVFKDFNVPLPRHTAFVIALAHRVIRYRYLIVVGLILIIAGAEWFMRVALSDQANSDSRRRLSRLLVVAPLVLIVLALIALSIPLFTLTTPLSG
jgi:type II secretory pathway component PulF